MVEIEWKQRETQKGQKSRIAYATPFFHQLKSIFSIHLKFVI